MDLLGRLRVGAHRLLGGDKAAQATAAQQAAGPQLPTSEDIIQGTDEALGGVGLQYEPKTTAGKFVQTGAEMLPGAVVPGQFIRGAGIAQRATKGGMDAVRGAVLPGVASEGAGQAAEGTGYEPAARVAGALLGGAVGTALPNPGMATPVPGFDPGATRRVNRAIRDEGGHDIVSRDLEELGPGGRLMDAGPGRNLGSQAEVLAATPGTGNGIIMNEVRERTRTAGDRLSQVFNQTLGDPGDFAEATRTYQAQRRAKADTLYSAAEQAATQMDAGQVVSVIDSKIPTVVAANATNPNQIEQRLLALRGQLTNRTDYASMHSAKLALDDDILAARTSGNNQLANSLVPIRDAVVRQLDRNTVDGRGRSLYQEARETYAGDSAFLDAREQGQSVLKRDQRADEFRYEYGRMTEAEKRGLQQGARDAVEQVMDNARFDATAARQLLQPKAARQKLETILGTVETDRIYRTIEAEARIAGTNARVNTGNVTFAHGRASKEVPNPVDAPQANTRPTLGQLGYHAAAAPFNAVSRMVHGNRAETIGRDMARMLAMPPGDERTQLLMGLKNAYEQGQPTRPGLRQMPVSGLTSLIAEEEPLVPRRR
jgi:hypothetical protein